jgi:hypothetical protein
VYDQNMKPLGRAQEPLSWPAWRRRQIRLLAGHMPFGFASHFPGASEYFTFLRDPVERAVSDYYFCRRDPANEAHAAAMKLSLIEFAEANYSFVGNGLVRWLSNAAYRASFPSEEKMFAAALKNLEQISFVGTTEEFDLSVERLCQRFGLRRYSAVAVHKNKFTPEDQRLSLDERRILERYNARDMELYRHWLGRFGPKSRASAAT